MGSIARLALAGVTCTLALALPYAPAAGAGGGGGSQESTSATAAGQPDLPLLRRETSAVLVGVSVRDADGLFVERLRPDDFRVYDEDIPQAITFFAADERPLDILLAIDMSGSMALHLVDVRRAVRAFFGQLRPVDRLLLTGFNASYLVLASWDATPAERIAAVDHLSARGATAFYDAIGLGIGLLRDRDGRRAMIFFTDGDDTGSLMSPDVSLQALFAEDVLLYVVGYGSAGLPPTRFQLEQIARRTGGQALFVRDIEQIAKALAASVQDLRQQYTLGYAPGVGTPGEWRTIRVEVGGGYQVRAREGYIVR